MKEENGRGNPESAEEEVGIAPEKSGAAEPTEPDLGKFKNVEALVRAYKELEAEFTRRSQKLKALENPEPHSGNRAEEARPPREEELYREVSQNDGVRARVLSDYLNSLKGVPLMAGGGTGVTAAKDKPKTIREAGNLALGYLKKQTK